MRPVHSKLKVLLVLSPRADSILPLNFRAYNLYCFKTINVSSTYVSTKYEIF